MSIKFLKKMKKYKIGCCAFCDKEVLLFENGYISFPMYKFETDKLFCNMSCFQNWVCGICEEHKPEPQIKIN